MSFRTYLQKGGVRRGQDFICPPLPYAYNALEPEIDALTMRLHHNVHYQKYTDKFNVALQRSGIHGNNIQEILSRIFAKTGTSNVLKDVRDNGGGYANHSLYFRILTPGGSTSPVGTLATAIKKQFGSVSALKKELSDSAKNQFGAGWAWLALTPDNKLVVFSTLNQDSPLMWDDIPLIGIDVWEHAYYKKYGPDREAYVDAVMGRLNWDEISGLYEDVTKDTKQ